MEGVSEMQIQEGLDGDKRPKIFMLAFSNFNYVINPFLHSKICESARRLRAQNNS